MAKDFSSDTGGVQGVAPNTAAPRTSDTPVTGFDSAPMSHRAGTGPGEGIQPNTKKIS